MAVQGLTIVAVLPDKSHCYLLMSPVASVLECRKSWTAPYTCAFDSLMKSSASKVTVPHGHIPASIPWYIQTNTWTDGHIGFGRDCLPAVRSFSRSLSFSVLQQICSSSWYMPISGTGTLNKQKKKKILDQWWNGILPVFSYTSSLPPSVSSAVVVVFHRAHAGYCLFAHHMSPTEQIHPIESHSHTLWWWRVGCLPLAPR